MTISAIKFFGDIYPIVVTSINTMTIITTLKLLLMISTCSGILISEEEKLFRDLFVGYDNGTRPVLNHNETIDVLLTLQVKHLLELNTKDDYLKIQGWVSVEWTDEHLKWDPSDYGGQKVIVVKPEKIWLPPFSPDNKLRGSIYDKDWYDLFRASVYSDGKVIWEPGGQFVSECETDVTYFPFDEQICRVIFSNWVYHENQVNLSAHPAALNEILEVYKPNGQWAIKDVHVRERNLKYSCCKEGYPEVEFHLHLKRKILFYFINLVYVSILLSCLVVVATKVPPETGERIVLGVSTLLAYIVFLTMAHQYVPATSKAVPVIVIYFVTSMFVNVIALSESAFSASCYYRTDNKRAPRLLRLIILKLMAQCLCYKLEINEDGEEEEVKEVKKRLSLKKFFRKRKKSRMYEINPKPQHKIEAHCRIRDNDKSPNGAKHNRGSMKSVRRNSQGTYSRRKSLPPPTNKQCADRVKSPSKSEDECSIEDVQLEEYPIGLQLQHSQTLAECGSLPTTDLPVDVLTSIVEKEFKRRQSNRQLASILEESEESCTSSVSPENSDKLSMDSSAYSDEFDGVDEIDESDGEVDYDYINSLIDKEESFCSQFSDRSILQVSSNRFSLFKKQSKEELEKFRHKRSLIKNLNASVNGNNSPFRKHLQSNNEPQNAKFRKIQREIKRLNDWYEAEEEIRVIRMEWITIAQTLDVFFFWLLLVIYVSITMLLLAVMPTTYTVKI